MTTLAAFCSVFLVAPGWLGAQEQRRSGRLGGSPPCPHARRYFVTALDAGDKRAALPLAAFKRLYKTEDELRALEPGRQARRTSCSQQASLGPARGMVHTAQQHEPPASKLARGAPLLHQSPDRSCALPCVWLSAARQRHCRAAAPSARLSLGRPSYLRAPMRAENAPRSRTRFSARAASLASIRVSISPTSCRT